MGVKLPLGSVGSYGRMRASTARVFIGYDHRQPVAFSTCAHSIVRNASGPVAITPLILSQLPITRR